MAAACRGLAARGESPASHRDRRGARLTRREEGEYWVYSTDEQRSQPGCIVGRMQRDFCHGLLGPAKVAAQAAQFVIERVIVFVVGCLVRIDQGNNGDHDQGQQQRKE